MSKAEQAYNSARANEFDTAIGKGLRNSDDIQAYIYRGVIENAEFYATEFGVTVLELLAFHR